MGSSISSEECTFQHVQNISVETVSGWLFSPVDTVLITIVVPIILGLGVFTNVSLLFVFLRVPRLRSETDVYLAHLALSDVLFLILSSVYDIRRMIVSPLLRHEPFSSSVECVISNFARVTTLNVSVALVTMVTFERYLALCHPIQHLKMRSRRRTYKMVAICWGIGVVLAVLITPNFAKYSVKCLRWPEDDICIGFPSQIAHCTFIVEWMENISEPLLNIPWCIAMIGNIYMYVRIIHMLNKRKGVNAEGKSRKANVKARQIRNQVTKMLVVNGVVFFLCQAPFALLNLSAWICRLAEVNDPLDDALGVHADWMVFIPLRINSVVNPLIYCAFSSNYRAAFTEAFGCSRCESQHATNQIPAVSGQTDNQVPTQSVAVININETRL